MEHSVLTWDFSLPKCPHQPDSTFQELSKCLLGFDSRAVNLQSELKCLATQWPRLKMSALEEYKVRMAGDGSDDDGDDDDEKDTSVQNKQCKSCKECPICCYKILQCYNLFTYAYHILGLGYKFLLTLPVTQIACERSLSALKCIKSQLRSAQSQEHLEAFMLMTTSSCPLTMTWS